MNRAGTPVGAILTQSVIILCTAVLLLVGAPALLRVFLPDSLLNELSTGDQFGLFAAILIAAGLHTLIAELPELLECHRVTGNESFLLKLVITSIPHLERVLNQLMNYGPVTTSIVLSTPRSGEPLKQEAISKESTLGN